MRQHLAILSVTAALLSCSSASVTEPRAGSTEPTASADERPSEQGANSRELAEPVEGGAVGEGRGKDDRCKSALEHLAGVAEKGENQIPRKQYIAENGDGFMKTCVEKFSDKKVECLMTMTDISGDEWTRCE